MRLQVWLKKLDYPNMIVIMLLAFLQLIFHRLRRNACIVTLQFHNFVNISEL